jgi:DUF1365 family protein
VSFYYCYDADGTSLRAVLAEITNTPWNERHAYVLRAGEDGADETFAKAFHVSPFLPMEQRYRWRLPVPGESLVVEMENEENGRAAFRARLSLERRPLTRSGLVGMALSRPLMSARILLSIYWQAFRLWLKGAPFYAHPKTRIAATTRRSEA